LIEDRSWCGTVNDIDVINFVQEHEKEIANTFETARNKNEVIKCYFEMEVEFYHRNGLEKADVQYATARFNIPPMTSDLDELNLPDIISQFMEKIDEFSGQSSCLNVSQIRYLRHGWGCYRLLMAGTFITTPKSIALVRAIVNVKCVDDDSSMQKAGIGTRGTDTCYWNSTQRTRGTGTRATGTAGLGHALLEQRDWDTRYWNSATGTRDSGTFFVIRVYKNG